MPKYKKPTFIPIIENSITRSNIRYRFPKHLAARTALNQRLDYIMVMRFHSPYDIGKDLVIYARKESEYAYTTALVCIFNPLVDMPFFALNQSNYDLHRLIEDTLWQDNNNKL